MRTTARRRAGLASLALALAATACGNGTPDAGPTTSPTEAVASPLPTASPSSSADPSASPSDGIDPSPSDSAVERDPTDTDRARFVAEYRPEGASGIDHVQVDLDGDAIEEVVVSYVRSAESVAHLDVAFWNGTTDYEVLAGADGSVADRVERVRVDDLNGDGVTEIALFSARGGSGASATLWAASARRLVPMRAHGGCHDGSNTYGVIGADIEDRDGDGIDEIYATCDDSPVPVTAWSTDVYRWTDGAWVHDPDVG